MAGTEAPKSLRSDTGLFLLFLTSSPVTFEHTIYGIYITLSLHPLIPPYSFIYIDFIPSKAAVIGCRTVPSLCISVRFHASHAGPRGIVAHILKTSWFFCDFRFLVFTLTDCQNSLSLSLSVLPLHIREFVRNILQSSLFFLLSQTLEILIRFSYLHPFDGEWASRTHTLPNTGQERKARGRVLD